MKVLICLDTTDLVTLKILRDRMKEHHKRPWTDKAEKGQLQLYCTDNIIETDRQIEVLDKIIEKNR